MSELHSLALLAGFLLVALSSERIGKTFVRLRLPLITGFLATGVVAGPFVLDLITREATQNLVFVDQISLAIIAFAAGHELYLKELRERYRAIAWHTVGQGVATFVGGTLTVLLIADWIPFLSDASGGSRVAAALLVGAILIARSPSSAIAVVNELRAKGPFTRTVLGVTVVMDIVVIVLFAVAFSIAFSLESGQQFAAASLGILLAEIVISIVSGLLIGFLISILLKPLGSDGHGEASFHLPLAMVVLLVLGYGVFAGADAFRDAALAMGIHAHLEPLLICMVASFYVTNFSDSRVTLEHTLETISPPIYIVFFTLTGASLELDVIAQTWPIALVLFAVRTSTIFIGGRVGGRIAGEPPAHNKIAWMAYMTQAGVALGLAKGVATAFPSWGPELATTLIALVVLNQVVGPPFFKWAIVSAGESFTRAEVAAFDGVRDVMIFGVEGQSLALARSLQQSGWHVAMVSPDTELLEEEQIGNFEVRPMQQIDKETMATLELEGVDAIVTLLSDDENFRICELAYENYGTRTLVTRLNDHGDRGRFEELGVLVIDPSTAMVSLLESSVRSPTTTSMLLRLQEGMEVVDVEVGNPAAIGLQVRELRLPLRVAVLYVHRDGSMISSTGTTVVERGDRVTLSGPLEDLERAMLRLEAGVGDN